MTTYLTAGTTLPQYFAFPRFLLSCRIPETAKLLYMLLLNRARLSMKSDRWIDENNHVFLSYTIHDLAAELRRSEMTVKKSLKVLEEEDLICRKRQAPGLPNRIYVKIPIEQDLQTERKLSFKGKENGPPEGQKTFPVMERKLSTSNKENSNNKETNRGSNAPPGYGSYQNVFLTEKEYLDLQKTIKDCDQYIERLSTYMASTGKTYQNHAATIKRWAEKDNNCSTAKRSYECREGESL